MANAGIPVRIYLEGDPEQEKASNIAFGEWVAWIRTYEKQVYGQKNQTCEDLHLCYTGEDGWLRYADRWGDNKLRRGTSSSGKGEILFVGSQGQDKRGAFKSWQELTKRHPEAWDKNNTVRISLRDMHTFFLWSTMAGKTGISLADLKQSRAMRHFRPDAAPSDKRTLPLKVMLPTWDYLGYFKRMTVLTSELTRRIDARRTRLGAIGACASLIDQVENHIKLRSRMRFQKMLRNTRPEQRERITPVEHFHRLALAETDLLKASLIQPLREVLKKAARHEARVFEIRVDPVAKLLESVLISPGHNKTYIDYFYAGEQNKILANNSDVVDNFMYWYGLAYQMLSQSKNSAAIYDAHIAPFLKAHQTKKLEEIKEAVKTVNKCYKWVKDMRGLLIEVVQARRMAKIDKELQEFQHDLVGALRVLESYKLAEKVDELEQAMNESMVTGRRVDASRFVKKEVPSNVVAAFKICLSTYSLMKQMLDTQKKKDLASALEMGNKVIGVGHDVTKLALEKGWVQESLEKTVKRANVLTCALDWGTSLINLYKDADTGRADKFAYSVVSYAGKALTLGGTILAFAIPGAGQLLMAAKAIDLLSGLYQGITEYAPPELEMFNKLLEETATVEKKANFNIMQGDLRVCLNEKVVGDDGKAKCEFAKQLQDNLTRREWECVESVWGGKKVRDIADSYFGKGVWTTSGEWWGVLQKVIG